MKKKDIDTLMHALEETNEFDDFLNVYCQNCNPCLAEVTCRWDSKHYDASGTIKLKIPIEVEVEIEVYSAFDYDESEDFVIGEWKKIRCDDVGFHEIKKQVQTRLEEMEERREYLAKLLPEAHEWIVRVGKKIGLNVTEQDMHEVLRRLAMNPGFREGEEYIYGRDLMKE